MKQLFETSSRICSGSVLVLIAESSRCWSYWSSLVMSM